MSQFYLFTSFLRSLFIWLFFVIAANYLHAQCNADFTYDTCCPSCPAHFTDLSTSQSSPITSWLWDFGDGGTSTVQNPVHVYGVSGTYNASLIITNDVGCTDTAVHTVLVYDLPMANYTTAPICEGDSSCFTDLSTAGSGNYLVSWFWDFGDGGTSTDQEPCHLYSIAGTYNVTLTVCNDLGCCDTATMAVEVYPSPVANFNASVYCNYDVFFTDLSIAMAYSIIAWSWDFGDGSTSSLQNPVHVYATYGTYNVCLTVTNSNGCIDSTCDSITILQAPNADFTFNSDCSLTTYFTDMSTVDPLDSIVVWHWYFGDGYTSYEINPVHTYATPGSYNVMLVIMCSCGMMDTAIREIILYPTPLAGFTYSPPDPSPGETVYFTDQSSSPDSNDYILEWRWYFGDGDSAIIYFPDNPDTEHIYADTGFYAVTLVVVDNDTCEGEITQMVNVNSMIQIWPTADFSHDYTCLNQYIHFTDQSSTNGGTPIVSWSWDFGDGGTSTAQNPLYLYANPGYYNISLVVTNADNYSDTVIKTLYAYPLPEATASAVPFTGAVGDTIQFYGSSANSSIVSWFWNFDDGTTAYIQNPGHIFQQSGLFDVSLTVSDTAGCMNTAYLQVRIYQPAAFPEDSTIWNTLGDNSISGDEWRFRYGMIGDTTINITDQDTSYTYSKVYSLYDSTLSTQYSTYFGAIRTTEEGQTYVLLPGFGETLLYDFNLEAGDTAWYSIGGALCSDGVELWAEEHYRVVTAIDTVEVYNGELRRRWTLEGDLMGDTWIEGIGSTHWYGLFNPLISDMTLCGDSYTFACMKQEDEVIYLNNPNCDHCFCDLLTVIGEQDQANPHAVNVYPNPMGGNTVIEFNLDQPVSVRVNLSDATGNIVKQLPYSTYSSGKQQIRLNSHDLNAGIYLLQITFDGRETYTVKLVKGR